MNRDDAWVDAVNRRIKMEGKTKHIEVLKTEMDVLASRLDPLYWTLTYCNICSET